MFEKEIILKEQLAVRCLFQCSPAIKLPADAKYGMGNKPLETTLRDRARAFRRRRRGPVEHSMLLEDQKVTAKDAEARLDEVVRETNPRLFWD
jgi:hypothetical protein